MYNAWDGGHDQVALSIILRTSDHVAMRISSEYWSVTPWRYNRIRIPPPWSHQNTIISYGPTYLLDIWMHISDICWWSQKRTHVPACGCKPQISRLLYKIMNGFVWFGETNTELFQFTLWWRNRSYYTFLYSYVFSIFILKMMFIFISMASRPYSSSGDAIAPPPPQHVSLEKVIAGPRAKWHGLTKRLMFHWLIPMFLFVFVGVFGCLFVYLFFCFFQGQQIN